ncbi:MAG: hypothetical protein KAI79_00515, partial [Bacteroidales bacterium]|nr:hypothetical protein [Bacteroidales bacterium]
MLEKKFVFADELSGIVIKDISKLIEKCKVVTFRVVNIKTQKTIGVLDFENSSCYLFKSPNKIIWNLYINNVIYEKEARKVANSI